MKPLKGDGQSGGLSGCKDTRESVGGREVDTRRSRIRYGRVRGRVRGRGRGRRKNTAGKG